MSPDRTPDHPLVSIVTPSFDPPLDKLERCLESVRAQTYDRIEHVVVDGGSTNGTLAMLEASTGVRWISEPDEGQCDALNKAFFRESDGELVVWLNADDILYPDSVARTVAVFAADPELGWVYGNLDREEGGRSSVIEPPAEATLAALDFNNVGLISPGSTFARWALERVGDLDEEFRMEMDLDYSIRLLRAGVRGAYIPHSLALLEIYDTSKSGSTPLAEIAAERSRIYLKHGMFQQAGAALALAGRYEISEQIEGALVEHRYSDARASAARGLRFMPSVLTRHRISFWTTRLAPRLMAGFKRARQRI